MTLSSRRRVTRTGKSLKYSDHESKTIFGNLLPKFDLLSFSDTPTGQESMTSPFDNVLQTLRLLESVAQATSIPTSGLRVAISIVSGILTPQKPLRRQDVSAEVVTLQSQATIVCHNAPIVCVPWINCLLYMHEQAAFLAAVQAQTLAFSIQNNSTRLLIAANTIAVMGLLFDIISAFLALLSSTLIQSNMQLAEGALDDINLLDLPEIEQFIQNLDTGVGQSRFFLITFASSRLGLCFAMDMVAKMKARTNNPDHGSDAARIASVLRVTCPSVETIVKEIVRLTGYITTLRIVSYAAAMSTLSGILCFLVSLIYLATATQPRVVWICAITACSCIILFPLLGALLVTPSRLSSAAVEYMGSSRRPDIQQRYQQPLVSYSVFFFCLFRWNTTLICANRQLVYLLLEGEMDCSAIHAVQNVQY